ncbi:MAG: glycosyltransferase [Tepidisphaeraceae bacterium]
MAFDLSIIIPTCNRCELLGRLLASLKDGLQCAAEIIVVDGASTDNTSRILDRARDEFASRLKIIREETRGGFVRAANIGFRAASGRNMIWLNDDSKPLPGSIDQAVIQIDEAEPSVGFLAMFHRVRTTRNVAYEVRHEGIDYRLCHVRGTLYANFPIGRRETFERLGFFDEGFYFYGADPDLSLKAWSAGLTVEPAWGVLLDHDEHADARREEDSSRAQADNQRLFSKWDLPARNPFYNDFDPANPCTLRKGNSAPSSEERRISISFLISTHNRRQTIAHTLENLQEAQRSSGIPCETILIDNASTDGTAEMVAERFPSVCVLPRKKNRGPCSKNAGLPLARGEFVVFLDDDSHPTPESLGNMIRHFRTDPLLGAAVFDAILPDGSRECSAYPSVFIGCGVGFRREALIEAGGLPEDFFMQAEEYDLSLRLLDRGWRIERFLDLRVLHRKSPTARIPTRTARLDVRNNLLVLARNLPGQWVWPFAWDWMRRYRWIAQSKGLRYRIGFWVGLIQGSIRALQMSRRKPISDDAFEQFSMINQIHRWMERSVAAAGHRRILLLDVGKNILPFQLAAEAYGIRIVAIADPRLARQGRKYRGIPVILDSEARRLKFDAAVIANVSPVHVTLRRELWRSFDGRPVLDVFQSEESLAVAA